MLKKFSGRIYKLKDHTENFTQKTMQYKKGDKNMKDKLRHQLKFSKIYVKGLL